MKAHRGRPPRLDLDAAEAGTIHALTRQLAELLDVEAEVGTGDPGDPLAELVGPMDSGEPSSDPVVRRLLPDAYTDDEDAAAEWRRFGRGEVRAAKSSALAAVLEQTQGGGPVVVRLDADHLGTWLRVVTDLRLAIGTRLDVTEDWVQDALALAEDDPRRPAYALYDWLSVLQESILRVAG